jgi:hypothetical protein
MAGCGHEHQVDGVLPAAAADGVAAEDLEEEEGEVLSPPLRPGR